jgi:PAB1-binding protein PBP1
VIRTLPQTTIPVGPGSTGAIVIGDTITQLVPAILMVGWPGTNQKIGDFRIDWGLDGVNWNTIMSTDVFDTPTPAHNTVPANTIKFACTIPPGSGRRIQVAWNFSQSRVISGTVEAN